MLARMETEMNHSLIYIGLAVMTLYGMSQREGIQRILLPIFSLLAALRFAAVM